MAKIGKKFQPTQLKRYEFAGGGSVEMTLSPDMARNLSSYRVPQNMAPARNQRQMRAASGPPQTMGQGKLKMSQDPLENWLNKAAGIQQEDRAMLRQMDTRNFAESSRRFDTEAEISREQNRISRLQANNENNYRMGSLGVERYKADQDFAVNNRQLDQERELTLSEMNMKQNQFREGLGAERQERAADRAAQYTDREQQLEGLRYQQDAETKRTKIQAQTSRYGADLDYASRIASNFSNNFQQGNQGWGQMIASFLSR